MHWYCKAFDQLSLSELYAILQLRAEVFVLEQQCFYQDLDECDQEAYHLAAWKESILLGYVRLLPPGQKYATPSLGRVVNRSEARGGGLGKELLNKAIAESELRWPGQGIIISAQQYLERFYQDVGFSTQSRPYLEDGIPHIEMLRPPDTRSG